jgi:hypothetical protein
LDGGWGWWYILQRRACGRDPPEKKEKSLWAGPTRGLWFFVRGACGRDPPGGGRFLKKDLAGDTLDTPITPELL